MKPLAFFVCLALALAATASAQTPVTDVGQALRTQAIDPRNLPSTVVFCAIRNAPFVVLRAEAKLESPAVATLLPEDKIVLIGRLNDWAHVTTAKGTGYMRAYYLQEPAGGSPAYALPDLGIAGTSGASATANPAAVPGTTLTTSPTADAGSAANPPQRIQDDGGASPASAPKDRSWLTAFDRTLTFSDEEFTDKDCMTREQIQQFLVGKNSCLQSPRGAIRPCDAIYDAAQKYGISPKALLARLQTEQGLVCKRTATDKEFDWALGVGCYDSGNWNQNFKGFDKQVAGAAQTYRRWYDEGKKQGGQVAMTIDGQKIVTRNAATFSIYKYCPHFSGAELNWKVYKGFFGK